MNVIQTWKDLSISKKLYLLVGIMALLVITELFTLIFTMNILSAVRAFVGGEAIWSKAQKDAIYNLERYVVTENSRYYDQFLENMKIPKGDHLARIELEKENMNLDVVTTGFTLGGNHPDDILPMIRLIRRFYKNKYIAEAINYWKDGDRLLDELIAKSTEIHKEVLLGEKKRNNKRLTNILDEIYILNQNLTSVETKFSATLGAASRWIESILSYLLILIVSTVEFIGLGLTLFRENQSLKMRVT